MIPRQTQLSFPVASPYQGMVGGWPNYPAVVWPLQTLPYGHNARTEDLRHNRKVLLTRSVYDLVYNSIYLDLTDSRLLGWYLSLSPDDRSIIQDEGGLYFFLKNHPFLEISKHNIGVKSGITHQPCRKCIMHKPVMPGLTGTFEETHPTNVAPENLPPDVMENLAFVGGSNNDVYDQPDSFYSAHSSPVKVKADHQRAPQMANSSSGAAVSNNPGFLANFSLDVELERCKRQNPEPTPVMQSQSHITDTGISPLKSKQSAIRKELSSECCSLGNIHLDGTECNNSIFKTGKYGEETIPSLNRDPDSYHTILQDDKSIVLLVQQPNNRRGHSDEGASQSGTPATCKTDQPVIQKTTAEKFTSPMPSVPTCDVMVGTEQAVCSSAFTQTQNPTTTDKHFTTELYMSDLDYLAEEFIKLKTERDKLRKGKMKCSCCKSGKKSDYVQRAQQAELSLLALQYKLYRQHYLKVCSAFAKTDQPLSVQKNTDHHCPESHLTNVVSVLKKLESDYNDMRENIQAGIPLHDLKLLSVDCAQITGAYVPAQRTGDLLGDSASRHSQQPQNNTSAEEPGCPPGENGKDSQDSQICMNQLQKDISEMRGALTLIQNETDTGHNTHKLEDNQSATPFKDLSMTEAWYDAEENLEPAVAAETELNTTMTSKHGTDDDATGEKKMSSVLCVSGLPSDVTEVDLMLWFKKYHVSEAHICTLENDAKFAIVKVSSHQSAEAAVGELSGYRIHGHTLQVEQINKARAGDPSSLDPLTQHMEIMHSNIDEVTTPLPLASSLKQREVVNVPPMAEGACLPQRRSTTGSFDLLMAELTQHHPDVSKQQILDALLELWVKHQGVLSGMPLSSIRQMTSDILTRPASTTRS